MKIFYFCYGRAHSSVIAGHIHLQTLPNNRIPTIKEILAIPEFDKSDYHDFGIPYFLGKDSHDNEIFIIGFANNDSLCLQTISFIIKQRSNPNNWRFYNALEQVNWLTKFGGFFTQRLKLVTLGRYLVALGIRKSYWRLVKMVKSIKEIL